MLSPVQTVMIADDSFNFGSLSLLIMFTFKQFIMIDDSWQNYAKRPRNCKQNAPRSAISMALVILVKKLWIKDTEAYRKITRMNYKTLWEILVAICHLLFAI